MKVKTLTRIKFFAMIIVPIVIELTLVRLEWLRIVEPEGFPFVHIALYLIVAVSIFRYKRRCRMCGEWYAVKEISRVEINRMEHPREGKKRKVYQVRYNVIKRCKRCGKERLYEIIKDIKEKNLV